MASTCIQGKMEFELEIFHCDRAHLFAVRSSSLASQYIMRLCCKANICVDYGQPKLWAKMIVRHIEQTYQYTISYLNVWRAKQRVYEMRFGTYEASHDNLPRMLSHVATRNPGSFYDTYLVPAVTRGQRIMQRAFFCIGACVRAFQFCLPMICIDATFLTGRYKG